MLRDTELTLTRNSRRAEVRPGARSEEVKVKSAFVPRFPANTNNIIPQKVYSQMKDCFDEMSAPKEKRKHTFLDTFTFDANKQKVRIVHKVDKNTRLNETDRKGYKDRVPKRNSARSARRHRKDSDDSQDRNRSRSLKRGKKSFRSAANRKRSMSPTLFSSDNSGRSS